MPDHELTPSSLVSASQDLSLYLGKNEPPSTGKSISHYDFIAAAPKARKGVSVSFKRPMPKLAAEMDARSKGSTGYRSLDDRIGAMREAKLLSSTDGWTAAADRKSNVLKLSSNKKLASKMEDETDILNSYWGWRGIMTPEYDMLEGYTLLDVEALYKRAIDRMHSLAFRNGVHIVGEDENYVGYLKDRIAQVGYVMKKGFSQWLKDVIKNLWVASNCIVAKVRDTEASGGVKSDRNGNMVPVAGYAVIPPHTIFPYLDGYGHIEKWRRLYKDGRPYRDYLPEDIIHFKWDVKPGHIFGTPRIVSVRDDIFALRRLEENVELLLINHLFPLFHVKVGDKDNPVEYLPDGSSEIDYVRSQIMNMPKEGVFVTDNRVEIEVVGAEGKGVDPGPMVTHFLTRVMIGMGVSGIDLGMTDTANRSTADSVSQNLKEMVKSDLQCFSDMTEMEIFREMFQESRIKMSVQKAVATTHLDFGEIDVDGQIKMESHALNSFQNHAIDQDELRRRYRANPFAKDQEKNTHFQKHMVGMEKVKAKLTMEVQEDQHAHEAKLQAQAEKHQTKLASASEDGKLKAVAVTAASTKKTKVTTKTSAGSSHTKEVHEPTSHAKKALSNIVQPANQHGKNLDPHKARSSEDPSLAQAIYDKLLDIRDRLVADGPSLGQEAIWRINSGTYLDQLGLDPADTGVMKYSIGSSMDEDLIWAILQAHFPEPDPTDNTDETEEINAQVTIEEVLS